jgi:hypothetical protein
MRWALLASTMFPQPFHYRTLPRIVFLGSSQHSIYLRKELNTQTRQVCHIISRLLSMLNLKKATPETMMPASRLLPYLCLNLKEHRPFRESQFLRLGKTRAKP